MKNQKGTRISSPEQRAVMERPSLSTVKCVRAASVGALGIQFTGRSSAWKHAKFAKVIAG
jgi:hypothetical protein